VAIQSNGGSISITAKTKVGIKAPQITIDASGTLDLKAGPAMTLKAGVININ
jgi:NaMN:DMB phosphoribosyltransferase